MPRTSRGRSNPVEEKELEYEIYGWFKFEDDAKDVPMVTMDSRLESGCA